MAVFFDIIKELNSVKQLEEAAAKQQFPILITGLSNLHKANLIYYLSVHHEKTLLVLTDSEQTAKKLSDDLNHMSPEPIADVYPYKDMRFRSDEVVSNDYEQIRLSLLYRIATGKQKILFSSINAALQFTMPKKHLLSLSVCIQTGQTLSLDKLVQQLNQLGYQRRPQVEGKGQYSVRGGILDCYAISEKAPARIEFFGDDIDSISFFDLDSQRRTHTMQRLAISPASEALYQETLPEKIRKKIKGCKNTPQSQRLKEHLLQDLSCLEEGVVLKNLDKYLPFLYEQQETLLDYFENHSICICEWLSIQEHYKESLAFWQEDYKILEEEGILFKEVSNLYADLSDAVLKLSSSPLYLLDSFAHENTTFSPRTLLHIQAVKSSNWNGNLSQLIEDLNDNQTNHATTLILAGTERSGKTLAADLSGEGVKADFLPLSATLQKGNIYTVATTLSSGLEYPDGKIFVINQAGRQTAPKRRAKRRKGEEIRSLSDLKKGDLVVHVSHGIGVFDGIIKLDVQNVTKDYLKIKYAGSDVLYVPVTQLDLMAKYIGAKESGQVKLNRMGSGEWQRAQGRVKKAVREMAEELIKLYAKRSKMQGFAFSPDNDWQRSFEEHFEYQETDDQLTAIDEIKKDMQKPRPMERLLCGDVGFGKTEVALRAVFKCVLDGKQAAILCPTTILAWQHYQTTLQRIGEFPINVELLSRFRSQKEQNQILKKLKNGQIDIIIGTHRLVQKDVVFHDLGLAIIDEEQRFGVMHKERFKTMFENVDLLSLSATPIPRTLNMAMSGIRDMSVLEQPPQDRLPIQTHVMEYNEGIIYAAIEKELRRNGQVYYLHNRIESIERFALKLQNEFVDAKVGVAHGRMGERELSKVWKQLMEHEIDILVCTTIIETGVDVPNCNTLIIENADRMGLAQLYQIRGRVGRSKRRAYAYFTFPPNKSLSELSTKRLEAIREFTQFGSGFRIALRDLEIRGAGSILGERQHGHMEAVGYDMYIRLLSEAVSELQGKSVKTTECVIDVPIASHIPEQYIENLQQRIEIYRKIAVLTSQEDKCDLIDELIDRYGEPPTTVLSLMDIALLRAEAAKIGFTEITQRDGKMLFYFHELSMELIQPVADLYQKRFVLNAAAKPHIAIRIQKEQPQVIIQNVLFAISSSQKQSELSS